MFRFAHNYLAEWRVSNNRKPLIIRGARQVGKTWLMKTFGQNFYDNVAYINFENNERMRYLFKDNYDIDRILTGLQIESNTVIDSKTLIIFDEVQEVPNALSSLKYFQENAPEYHIIAAGSVLGVLLHSGTSFPVGKVDFLDLHPMNFDEFLIATGNEPLVDLMNKQDTHLINSFKTRLIELLRTYYFVGGLPEAVQVYLESNDFSKVREVHQRLLFAYEQDFSKHASYELVPRIRQVWNSIPTQLSRENRKFIYGTIRQGARAREYELALLWLEDSGLIRKVYRAVKPEIPLKAFQDNSAFKTFILDVGLLGALSQLDALTLLNDNQIFLQFKGALTEQYVFQQLISNNRFDPFYWSEENRTAEVDFLIQSKGNIFPIEVKAEENLRAKSLKVYQQRFNPIKGIRTSMADFRNEGWLANLPLYMVNHLESIISNPTQ